MNTQTAIAAEYQLLVSIHNVPCVYVVLKDICFPNSKMYLYDLNTTLQMYPQNLIYFLMPIMCYHA